MSTKLLTNPTLVESPFIIIKIGDYEFGSYLVKDLGSTSDFKKLQIKSFPNYVTSLTVTKVNGSLNQYNFTMEYRIGFNTNSSGEIVGDDPNFLDKVFSKVGYGKIKISYGDWSLPAMIYKEEEAIITKINSRLNLGNSLITYDVTCVSNALKLMSSNQLWNGTGENTIKPSTKIKEILNSLSYGLKEIFPGMYNNTKLFSDYIASDDREVKLQDKETDVLSYLNYLVSCMISLDNNENEVILNSRYYLTIYDDAYNENGGAYFKVIKVNSQVASLALPNTYEIDVNYPGGHDNDSTNKNKYKTNENLITSFDVNTDMSWILLYKYDAELNQGNYVYRIDNKGNSYYEYSPLLTYSTAMHETTAALKTWWSNMTSFPITATMLIKGLIRPMMLMSYIKVNTLFYGQKHISSGLYIITKLTDTINSNGYKTRLELTRVGGDDDYVKTGVDLSVDTSDNKTFMKTLQSSGLYKQLLDANNKAAKQSKIFNF